jgi:hypothetical protein
VTGILCPEGKFSSIAGHYHADGGDLACTPCPSESLTTPPGATHQEQCSCGAGYFPSTGTVDSDYALDTAVCLPCPPGSKKSSAGFSECDLCVVGKYSGENAATTCADCIVGKYAGSPGAAECTSCPFNHTTTLVPGSDDTSKCSCIRGFQGESAEECIACAPGKYKDFIGLGVACTECEKGKYNPDPGQSSCLLCPRGTFSATPSATEQAACQSCSENAQSPEGSSERSACRCNMGYTSIMSQYGCRACAAGSYKHWPGQENCNLCPPFSSSSPASTRLVDCTCIPG